MLALAAPVDMDSSRKEQCYSPLIPAVPQRSHTVSPGDRVLDVLTSPFRKGSKTNPRRGSFKSGTSTPTLPAPSSPPLSAQWTQSTSPPLASTSSKSRYTRDTPPDELPQQWGQWNEAYRHGIMDFESMPEPPMPIPEASTSVHGTVRAPEPIHEASRMRVVAALDERYHDEQFDPKVHPLHESLTKLAQEAKDRFSVPASGISIMDSGFQVFLAEIGLDLVQTPRDGSICSHTIVKASTGQIDPLVILSFKNDSRVRDHNWGQQYESGFYSGCPIMLPSSLGDTRSPTNSYPAGVFCLIDSEGRADFSEKDRRDFMGFADRAGQLILDHEKRLERERGREVLNRLEGWRKTTSHHEERNPREKDDSSTPFGLFAIDETKIIQPPHPHPPTLRTMTSSEQIKLEMDTFAMSGRRPSLTPSLVSSTAGSDVHDLLTTDIAPVICRRSTARLAQGRTLLRAKADLVQSLPDSTRSLLDIATRLLSESLDITFACLVAVTLSNSYTAPSVELVSHHNIPIPAPMFDPVPLLELCTSSDHSSLLFVPGTQGLSHLLPASPIIPGSPSLGGSNSPLAKTTTEFETGLMVRVGDSFSINGQSYGFVLAGFSDDERRVISAQDLHFFRQFTSDIKRAVDSL